MADFKTFNRFIAVAHKVYDRRYAVSRPGEAYVLEDTRLVDFPTLVSNSFANILRDASIPVLARSRMWAWAPEPMKAAVYDSLAETLVAAAEEAGLDPSRAFPEPKKPADPQTSGPTPTDRETDGKRSAG
jgi:hypothetical protein